MTVPFTPLKMLMAGVLTGACGVGGSLLAVIHLTVSDFEQRVEWSEQATIREKVSVHVDHLYRVTDWKKTTVGLLAYVLPVAFAIGTLGYLLAAGVWAVFIT